MRLGELINLLKDKDPNAKYWNLGEPHSYHGYPGHIALRSLPGVVTAAELLDRLDRLSGTTVVCQNNKAHDWSLQTPVWVSEVDHIGFSIMLYDGKLELVYDD